MCPRSTPRCRCLRRWASDLGRPLMPADDPPQPDDPPADPESVARAICLRLLTARPRTRAELAAALRRRHVPDDAAEFVLDRLVAVGLVDDDAFAAAWVSSRHAGRGLASRALAGELRSRGVSADTVASAVAALDPETERATARRLVDRRLPAGDSATTAVRVRRLVAMLGRKGYPPALAVSVVREALADAAAEETSAEMATLESMADGAWSATS